MSKLRLEDIEISSPTETKVDGAEKLNALSWLCRHARQVAKGSLAVIGLLVLGGVGYWAKSFFGSRKTGLSDERSLVAKSEGFADFGSEIRLYDTVSDVGSATAAEKNDFDAVDTEARGAITSSCMQRSLVQNRTSIGYVSPNFTLGNSLTKIWAKSFEGIAYAYSAQQTTDGGYIAVGSMQSEATWIAWSILKLDVYGNKIWAKTFGGANIDVARSVQQITDGGYIVAGYTASAGAGGYYFLILKLDSFGHKVWAKTFGGTGNDCAYFIQQTTDSGYVIAGSSSSAGFLILKVDVSGNKIWAKTFGSGSTQSFSIQKTSGNGYVVAGYTHEIGSGDRDFLMLKLDNAGDKEWARTFGGSRDDKAYSVQQTTDSGYIVAGYTTNTVGPGYTDILVLKLDNAANKAWAKKFGHARYNCAAHTIQQTAVGGYIVVGYCGESSPYLYLLALKLDNSGNKVWAKMFQYSTTGDPYIISVQQTKDEGYIIALPSGQMLLIKLDTNGNLRNGCQGEDIPWETTDAADLILGDVSWTTQNATGLTLAVADTLVLADWNPKMGISCVRQPVVNIPMATQASCCTAGIGQSYSFVLANNTFIDSEEEPLTYTATVSSGAVLPSWLLFNPLTLTFDGMPISASSIGNLAITVKASNPNPGSITDTFTLKISQTLTATNLAAIINYIENTAYKLAPIVITTPSVTANTQLTLINTIAGNFTTGTSGSVTSTYDPATGIWLANGNIVDVNALLGNLWYQPSLDYHGGFSVAVNITDSFGQNLKSRLTALALVVPTLVYNNFKILLGSKVTLTPSMLNAEDSSVPASSLVFTLSNVQHGKFELTGTSGIAITSFTKQQLLDGRIIIAQDGSENAVAFNVKVTNGVASCPITSCITTLHHYTTLITGEISISKGEALVITLDMINARNPDDTPEQLIFTVSNVQNGRFEFLDTPGAAITSFTLRNIIDNRVRLIHDNSANPPLFSITVSDGEAATTPTEVRSKFRPEAEAKSGLSTFANLFVGAGASATAGFGFWVIKKKYSAHRKREKYPFANRIRTALNLGVTNFESDKGMEFLQTVEVLAKELLEKQGIDIKRLTHKELQELSVPLADAIKWHTSIRKEGHCMFSGNAINHKAVRDKISAIASDAARKWDEIAQLKNVHPTEKGAIEVLKEPLISPVVDRT